MQTNWNESDRQSLLNYHSSNQGRLLNFLRELGPSHPQEQSEQRLLGREEGYREAIDRLWEYAQVEPEPDPDPTIDPDVPESLRGKDLDFD